MSHQIKRNKHYKRAKTKSSKCEDCGVSLNRQNRNCYHCTGLLCDICISVHEERISRMEFDEEMDILNIAFGV